MKMARSFACTAGPGWHASDGGAVLAGGRVVERLEPERAAPLLPRLLLLLALALGVKGWLQ